MSGTLEKSMQSATRFSPKYNRRLILLETFMQRIALWLLTAAAAGWFARASSTQASDGNMVANGDFSALDGQGFPEKWKTVSKGDARAARVKGPDGTETTTLEFALTGAMTRIEQILTLKADRTYRVRFQAKAREAQTAGVYLATLRWSGGGSVVVKGTHDWKDYEFTASFPEAGTHRLILHAKEGTRGSVWFTNVSVEEVVAAAGPPALLPVGRMSRPPAIDGRIDEAEWREAVAAPPFAEIGSFRFTRFAREAAAAMTGYDDKNLYLAFRCEQTCLEPLCNNLDRFKAEKMRPDEDLFSDDCVLALIQPNAPNGPVYDFAVNANGVINDAKGTGPDPWSVRDSGWNSGARAAARVEDGYWTVELAIPLASVGLTPKAGREFSFMLGRINQAARVRSACFPMTDGFHNPPLFARARLAPAGAGGFTDVRIGALLPGENHFAFQAARAGIPFAVVTKGETGAPLRAELKTVAGANQVAYRLPGEEYSSLQFFFGGDYVSPPYVVDTRAAEFELRTAAANPMLGEGAVRSAGAGVFRFTSHAGLFPVENIAAPYALGRTDGEARFTFDGRDPEALLVGHTLFWPENRNIWSIAENSIQPLHVVLHRMAGFHERPRGRGHRAFPEYRA